jgi:hypothetical protein
MQNFAIQVETYSSLRASNTFKTPHGRNDFRNPPLRELYLLEGFVTSTPKLIELRQKTDRELPLMLQREVERGLILASVAATKKSPLYAKADKIYSKMKTLLPTLDGMDQGERSRLESKLHELRTALDRTPARAIAQQMTCSAQGD